MASSVNARETGAERKLSASRSKNHSEDSIASARSAGLRYTIDTDEGIRRIRSGDGFRYVGPDGKPIRDRETLHRIKSLVIPPAWENVWICPCSNGHLQATGRDARGRKQFRYHPRWREIRDETKYDRMIPFGRALPRIRQQVEQDLALPGLPRKKVLAAIVRLLETTLIRIGNEEYARQNGSFGLTTLRENHLKLNGSTCRFVFRGKSGKPHIVDLDDHRIAKIVQRCQSLPGEELFQYIGDDGQAHHVTSTDVNNYLREMTGEDFTAKDFRTWAGTVLAVAILEKCGRRQGKIQAKRTLVRAIEAIAQELGNTPAVCRKCYIHPEVINAYVKGNLPEFPQSNGRTKMRSGSMLGSNERKVLDFLRALGKQ